MMGTKANPGKFDCYEEAGYEEPMFILLARDPHAPGLVALWAELRRVEGDTETASFSPKALGILSELGHISKRSSDDKVREADDCSQNMREWYTAKNQP